MILPILAYGHPILRKKCKSIEENSEEIKSLISNMWETMYNAEGVGLAAPQVGVNKKIFIIDANPLFPKDQEISDFEKLNSKKVFINPEITEMDGDQCYFNEGCLSIPEMRAVRFASQLNFEIKNSNIEIIKSEKERINIVSKERIHVELNKILLSPKPSIGFILLMKTGLLEIILPELIKLEGIDEIEGKTHKDNFYHTLQVLDNICKNTNNLWLRWVALLHDIGKPKTKRYNKKKGWSFHGHEYVGSKMVFKIFKRLKLPLNHKLDYVKKLVLLSSRPVILSSSEITDSAIRRLIFDAGDDIDDLMTLCEADITTKNAKLEKKYLNNFKVVREKIKDVEERDKIRNFQPPISGKYIMDYFGIKPCKEIGLIKERIKEAILNGDINNDVIQAKELMIIVGEGLGLKKYEK